LERSSLHIFEVKLACSEDKDALEEGPNVTNGSDDCNQKLSEIVVGISFQVEGKQLSNEHCKMAKIEDSTDMGKFVVGSNFVVC